jgi:hypothetical protein
MIPGLTAAEYIQIGIGIVLTVTLVMIWVQYRLQNRLLTAQVLHSRFDIYAAMCGFVSEAEVDAFESFPYFIDKERYKSDYQNNRDAIRRYITCAKAYEYLAWVSKLRDSNLPDPFSGLTHRRWTKTLSEYVEFKDAHKYLQEYYPDFAKVAESIMHEPYDREKE